MTCHKKHDPKLFHQRTSVDGLTCFRIIQFIDRERHKQVGDVGQSKVGKHGHQVLLVLQPHYPREVAGRPSDVKLRPLSAPAVADVWTKYGPIGRTRLQACQPTTCINCETHTVKQNIKNRKITTTYNATS